MTLRQITNEVFSGAKGFVYKEGKSWKLIESTTPPMGIVPYFQTGLTAFKTKKQLKETLRSFFSAEIWNNFVQFNACQNIVEAIRRSKSKGEFLSRLTPLEKNIYDGSYDPLQPIEKGINLPTFYFDFKTKIPGRLVI
jgi:hypothetical protein